MYFGDTNKRTWSDGERQTNKTETQEIVRARSVVKISKWAVRPQGTWREKGGQQQIGEL